MPTISELIAKVDTSKCEKCGVKNEAPEKPETDVRAFGSEFNYSLHFHGFCKKCFYNYMKYEFLGPGVVDEYWNGISSNEITKGKEIAHVS